MAPAHWIRLLRKVRVDWEAVGHYALLIITGAAVMADVSRCIGG